MVHTRHSYSKDLEGEEEEDEHMKEEKQYHNQQDTHSATRKGLRSSTSPLREEKSSVKQNGHKEEEGKADDGVNDNEIQTKNINDDNEDPLGSKKEAAKEDENENERPRRKRPRRSEIESYAEVDYHCQRRSLRNIDRSRSSRLSRRKKKFFSPDLRNYGHLAIRRSNRQPKQVFESFNESEIMKTIDRQHQEMMEVRNSMYDSIKRRRDEETEDSEEDSDEEEEEEEDDDDNGEEEEEDEEGEEGAGTSYSLRKTKPKTNRYQAPDSRSSLRRRQEVFTMHSPIRTKRSRRVPQHASPGYRNRRRRRASSTSSSDDDAAFERRKAKSMMQGRARCLPMNFRPDDMVGILKNREMIGAQSVGASLADVDPMTIDNKTSFSDVGGLDHHINSLKEMVVFPLLYPEVFQKFNIAPPRGVLFYGPPGTGKTLVARALANECSKDGGQKIAFFMRKGADCLSKWVGESERQLRLLFDQAYSMRPSIIFFDEIDGIAPVRSTRQDQIHSSIVSTLLALMDGLDARGEIVVIGATNRLDSIDPALRRPGRFDREFLFTLPNKKARQKILDIHTSSWVPKLPTDFIAEVAERCVGYCGADIKALSTEAALFALRRRYPQIYESNKKLLLDVNQIKVASVDFRLAMERITPASHRSNTSLTFPLSEELKPLLEKFVQTALDVLFANFPPGKNIKDPQALAAGADEDTDNLFDRSRSRHSKSSHTEGSHNYFKTSLHSLEKFTIYRPRFLLTGLPGNGQTMYIAPALLYAMEHIKAHSLDLPSLFGTSSRTPEEAISQIFREAKRTIPSIIYLPHISVWWNSIQDTTRATFVTLLQDLPSTMPLLLLATTDVQWKDLPEAIQDLFAPLKKEVLEVSCPSASNRRSYFQPLFLNHALKQPPKERRKCASRNYVEVLPEAPAPKARELSKEESSKLIEYEENILRELRLHLRQATWKLLADRKFKEFSKPVDLEEVDDYLEVIKEPMDLSTIMTRINAHHYLSCDHYLKDINLITNNCLEYNPDKDNYDKLLRNRACELRDVAHALVLNDLDEDFEKTCKEVQESRKARGFDQGRSAPAFMKVLHRDKNSNNTTSLEAEVNKPPVHIPDPTGTRYSRRVRGISEPSYDSNMLEIIERGCSKRKEKKGIENIDNESSDNTKEEAANDTDNSQPIETAEGGSSEIKLPEETSMDIATTCDESSQDTVIDGSHVNFQVSGDLKEEAEKLLSRLVDVTENNTVQTLESIYTKLSQCLTEYKKEENRVLVLTLVSPRGRLSPWRREISRVLQSEMSFLQGDSRPLSRPLFSCVTSSLPGINENYFTIGLKTFIITLAKDCSL